MPLILFLTNAIYFDNRSSACRLIARLSPVRISQYLQQVRIHQKNHKNMNQTKQNEFNSFYAHGRITELAFINNFTKQNEMGKLTTSHENNYNNRMNGNVSGVINIHGTTIYSFTVST